MRVRASLVVSLIAAVVTTTPAGAAPPRISVDNVDSLQVVDTYDLGAARAYRFAIDREDLYLTEYVRTGDMARILRVDLDSGRILWSIDVSCTIGGPELAGSIVLLAAGPCAFNPRPKVTAVRAATGRTAWTAVANGAVPAGPVVILWRAREFAGGDRSVHLWAVHPATGRELWTYRSPGDVSRFLIARAVRDAVYLDDDGDVVAVDPRTGAVRWRRPVPPDGSQGLWHADPAGPYVYRRHGDLSFLTALDPDTGALRWRVAQPTGGFFDDGVAYVSLQTPTGGPTGVHDLEARSMADGSLLWTGLSMPQFFESSGGVLYGTRFDFSQPAPLRLVALDAATGRELAEYPTNYDSVVTPERYLMHAGEGVFDVYEPTR